MTSTVAEFKDDSLFRLSKTFNVARFFSVGPEAEVRRVALRGQDEGSRADLLALVEELLLLSPRSMVNVRSFRPNNSKGQPFAYGLRTVNEVAEVIAANCRRGLYSIVNETIDVNDGGVSGVALGGIVEFAPDDTPRAVEKPGVVSLPRLYAMQLLRTVYGASLDLPSCDNARVEFSIHPSPVGARQTRVLIWEREEVSTLTISARPVWPNRFSRHIGDKGYGLLMADLVGLAVPKTLVVSRRVAPFSFGASTRSEETWVRTCPSEQDPGRFPTVHGWTDPFELMQEKALASVLIQDGVMATFSGASLPTRFGHVIRGVAGFGDSFMLGVAAESDIPDAVVQDVRAVVDKASSVFGPVRIEWAHDGLQVWVLQMHQAKKLASDDPLVIVEGNPPRWHTYSSDAGLGHLRDLIEACLKSGDGIEVDSKMGLTSHVGDLLRKADVPSRLLVS